MNGSRGAHLNAGRAAHGHGVGYGGARRVDHRNEADQAQSRQRDVALLGVETVTCTVVDTRLYS